MMACAIQVMDSTGHTTITWEPGDADEEAKAREVVEGLKKLGYTFFLVSGEPADEVSAGAGVGKLIVRALGEDPIADLASEAELRSAAKADVLAPEQDVAPEPRRRGRPPRQPQAEAVGVRRMQGG